MENCTFISIETIRCFLGFGTFIALYGIYRCLFHSEWVEDKTGISSKVFIIFFLGALIIVWHFFLNPAMQTTPDNCSNIKYIGF